MRSFSICLCINLLVCFAFKSWGQNENYQYRDSTNKIILPANLFTLPMSNNMNGTSLTRPLLPKGYLYNNYSFFCKKELQIEKAIKFPVKMRLGSVTYTDRLEGKITSRLTE